MSGATEACTQCGAAPAGASATHPFAVEVAGVRLSVCAPCSRELARTGRDLTVGVMRATLEQRVPDAFAKMQQVWKTAQRVAEAVKE